MKTIVLAAAFLGACATKPPAILLVSGETLLIQAIFRTKQPSNSSDCSMSRKHQECFLPRMADSSSQLWRLHQKYPNVEVIGNCFSACANYIFPAGAIKTISGLGVVAWHGNMSHLLHMHASGETPIEAKDLVEVHRLAKLENEYFIASI